MKRLFAMMFAAALAVPVIGCSNHDHDTTRSTRTTTRIEPDGDRVTKTTTVKRSDDGETVRTSKTTTIDR
jgi:hypothetical protein